MTHSPYWQRFLSISLLWAALAHPARAEESLVLTSPAFQTNAPIPVRYTCDGNDSSPPLTWTGVPADARSLVLVIEDPDAPDPAAPLRTFVHWLVYDLPADSAGLVEDASRSGLPDGAREGFSDFRRRTYGGPCPPIGRHRYFHRLYALDVVLPDLRSPDRAALNAAMEGHVIAETQLVGTYQRR